MVHGIHTDGSEDKDTADTPRTGRRGREQDDATIGPLRARLLQQKRKLKLTDRQASRIARAKLGDRGVSGQRISRIFADGIKDLPEPATIESLAVAYQLSISEVTDLAVAEIAQVNLRQPETDLDVQSLVRRAQERLKPSRFELWRELLITFGDRIIDDYTEPDKPGHPQLDTANTTEKPSPPTRSVAAAARMH